MKISMDIDAVEAVDGIYHRLDWSDAYTKEDLVKLEYILGETLSKVRQLMPADTKEKGNDT